MSQDEILVLLVAAAGFLAMWYVSSRKRKGMKVAGR
jgi:hypothetical protein